MGSLNNARFFSKSPTSASGKKIPPKLAFDSGTQVPPFATHVCWVAIVTSGLGRRGGLELIYTEVGVDPQA